MYEYFGVDPQLLEDVDDVFLRFLCWMPKHLLSKPPKISLQAWVIDGLDVEDVSLFVCFFFFFFIPR